MPNKVIQCPHCGCKLKGYLYFLRSKETPSHKVLYCRACGTESKIKKNPED